MLFLLPRHTPVRTPLNELKHDLTGRGFRGVGESIFLSSGVVFYMEANPHSKPLNGG